MHKIIQETNPADSIIDVNMENASEKPKDVKEPEKSAKTKDEKCKKDEPPPKQKLVSQKLCQKPWVPI